MGTNVQRVSFGRNNSVFFETLKTKVDHYFSTHQIRKTGNAKLYLKTIILMISTTALYFTLLFFYPESLDFIIFVRFIGNQSGRDRF